MDDPTSLQLASTRELVEELLGRCDHAVFAGLCIMETNDGSPQAVVRRWKGNSFTCAGLSQEIARAVLDDFDERSEGYGADEDEEE